MDIDPYPVVDDAFGAALLAHLDEGSSAGVHVIERDDGYVMADGTDLYFAEIGDVFPVEASAVERARGRVLDIGTGAGRFALALQKRGHDVVALDVSAGCLEVCRRLGVEQRFSGTIFDLAAQNPADDVQNISYFISDGEANAGTSPIGSGYIEFANNNSVNSYSVGIGSSLPGDLSDLNYIHNIDSMGEGYGTVDPALIVEDVSQLQSELLSTVPTAFGGNITVDVDGSVDNVLFGADNGYVDSITIDLGGTDYTFTYDGSLVVVPPALAGTVEVDGSTINLDADDGFAYGTLTFDFSDGSYTFSAPNGTAPATVSFELSIVDGDGDTA